jgi:CRISPR-associated protein Cas1
MKRMLNTLFVMTQGSYLKKEGEAAVVKVGEVVKLRVPFVSISSIVCFGDVMMSPYLMGACAKAGISICWLSLYGRFLARVEGPVHGNVLLRREQYRVSEDRNKAASIARIMVAAKISNSRAVLLRAMRDHADKFDTARMDGVSTILKRRVEDVLGESDLDRIRGYEGDSAKAYFSVFNELILVQKADFSFTDRNRRPPRDRVNALLSFVYTMLYNDLRSMLEVTGLDPAVGFLHRDRPGRMSLALDLMEEFRPFVADRLVLSLINLKQVAGKAFDISESGTVMMHETARKTVVAAWQTRKQDALVHPFLEDEMHIGIAMQSQAMLLARHLRGDIDGYPAFFWK